MPDFPRTAHLPYHVNQADDDIIADSEELSILQSPNLIITEKVDGANAGMMLYEDEPVLRNREHILNKGYLKDTPAKLQFRPMWNWFYQNIEKFKKLNQIGFYSVYGEWCWMVHGVEYMLPDWFIAFDLFDYAAQKFVNAKQAFAILTEAGFVTAPIVHQGPIDLNNLDTLANSKSLWSNEQKEGIYLKDSDGQWVTKRFKMLRHGYVQGSKLSNTMLIKQKHG